MCIVEEATQEMQDKLEQQFASSLEHKLSGGARRHRGIGFTPEDDKKTEENKSESEKDNEGENKDKSEERESERESNKEEIHKDTQPTRPEGKPNPYKMMFVKSSS